MMRLPLSFLFLLLTAASLPAFAVEPASSARLDEVAERGRQVMPFNLEKTTHVFSKTNDGGRQEVLAKASKDKEQIRLIREHLSAIAANFAKGDFSGPAQIHGEQMPGLAELKDARPGQVKFAYRELPKGARIDFSTQDRSLIDAIHSYFDAQLRDHARHASMGGAHSHMHGQ